MPFIRQADSSRSRGAGWRWLFAAALWGLIGCVQKPSSPPPPKPPEVVISKAIRKAVTDFEDFTGRTEAMKTVAVRSRVTGYLDRVFFTDGQEVKEKDPLFEIDPRQNKAALDRAEASVKQAEARLKRLEFDYSRAKQLVTSKSISREEFDKISGDRSEAEASLEVAKADVNRARVELGYTRIAAPIDGRISRTYVDPFNLVKADDTVLTTLVSLDPMYCYFDVDERTLLRFQRLIQEGTLKFSPSSPLHVQVALADETEFARAGTIDFMDNQVDIATGTQRFRCVVPNPKRLLAPGLFVRVRLPIGVQHRAVLVPEQALGTDQGQKFVFVVDASDDVIYRAVKVGALHEGWRVVKEGVEPGERIIVSGLQRVRPGVRVSPKEPEPEPAKAR